MTETPDTKPRRRRLALSLRSLMVLVLAIGGLLGWRIYLARVQRDAVERIRKAGGNVSYDWEWRNGNSVPDAQPPWPNWLIDLTGPDFLSNVVALRFLPDNDVLRKIDDDRMTDIARLDRLEYLNLGATGVTDAGLAKIRGLTRLQWLNLLDTSVNGAGLAYLKDMVDLEMLTFPPSTVTDADLAHLGGMTKLTGLRLPGSRITDAGMIHLRNMKQLEYLNISGSEVTTLVPIRQLTRLKYLEAIGCPIDDVGAAPIADFRDLETLVLEETRITDRAIASFPPLPKLKVLDLRRTKITDAGLKGLGRLPSLQMLSIYDTQVTNSGLASMPILKTCKTVEVAGPNVGLLEVGELRKKFAHLRIIGPERYAQERVVRTNGKIP